MTTKELQYRQSWTLSQKIDHSLGAVEAFITQTGRTPYISFSGGKDSTVLLDLIRRFIDKDIKAVFCNTGNEYPEIVRFVKSTGNVTIIRPEMTVKQVLDKYGFQLISKEQAKGLRQLKTTKSEKLRNILLYGTPQVGISCRVRELQLLGGSRTVEQQTGNNQQSQAPAVSEPGTGNNLFNNEVGDDLPF